jgi:hypothetical protein
MSNFALKKYTILFVFLTGVILGMGGLWLAIQNNFELRYYLYENATAHPAQAQVSAFIQSVVQGDKTKAYKLWEISDRTSSEEQIALMKRRDDVITDLLLAKIESKYLIRNIEWWTICCEPNVTNDSRYAGGARITVQFIDQQGLPMTYIFDVFTQWGSSEPSWSQVWTIRDIYPREQNPMVWLRVYEPQIRYVQFPDP